MTGAAPAVHLYHAERRSLTETVVAALVTPEDRLRVTPAMAARRREEYLAGRALLRHALAERTGRDAASLRIELSASGKPECVGGPAISVSHSGDALVCALADVAVGVDVETKPPRDLGAVAERFFTAAEARWLAADPAPRFCMLWVLKEAYLKALGVGLAGGLASLDCRIEPPAVVARTGAGTAPPQLKLFRGKDCFVGVAAIGAPTPIEVVLHRFAAGECADRGGSLELIATT